MSVNWPDKQSLDTVLEFIIVRAKILLLKEMGS
jgi:hypothetical protein